MISMNSRVFIVNDGYARYGYGRRAMIVTMTTVMVGITIQTVIYDDADDDYYGWDDGGEDFVAVDNGGNDDRHDFGDSDEGCNDRTAIVNL